MADDYDLLPGRRFSKHPQENHYPTSLERWKQPHRRSSIIFGWRSRESPPKNGSVINLLSLTKVLRFSEHIPTALAIVPNKREKRLKKLLDAHQVELWK